MASMERRFSKSEAIISRNIFERSISMGHVLLSYTLAAMSGMCFLAGISLLAGGKK